MNSWAWARRTAASISPRADVGAAVGDVGRDGIAEEIGFLEDECDLRAQAGEGEVANVDAVDQDAAGAGVVEAGEKIDEGGLAGAGRSDDRDEAAARDIET